MIRVSVIDRRPAMRSGLKAILDSSADIAVVGSTGSLQQIPHMLHATVPDVLIVEDGPAGVDAMEVARRLKPLPAAPRVLIHAEGVDPAIAAAAAAAMADGVIDSAGTTRELLEAVRAVADGSTVFPGLDGAARGAGSGRQSGEDPTTLAAATAGRSDHRQTSPVTS